MRSAIRALVLVLTVVLVASAEQTTRPDGQTQGTRAGAPVYRIYPLTNGECVIAGDNAFAGGDPKERYRYTLYVWLILGGEKPILVDAGLHDVAGMNRGAAKVLAEPIIQRPDETVEAQLRRFGLRPADIGHLFITHLHYDHVDGLGDFPNAIIHVGRKEFERATANGGQGSWCDARILDLLCNKMRDRVKLTGDEEVLPGIRTFWIGGHTPGSMAVAVNTRDGRAVLTGDTISLLDNIERDVPVGVYWNLDECRSAMKRIREAADIALPSHDPGTLDRWPLRKKGVPLYTIRALKCGECQVRDYITFNGASGEGTSTFYLYVWVIQGAGRTIIVDTGPKDPVGFSRQTAAYIPGGVKQKPEERTPELLRRHGIDPAVVRHVIVTHLHPDHYDFFDAFPNAQLVVNREEYAASKDRLAPDVRKAIETRGPESLRLVGDEEIVPGIRTFRLGCHTVGSQAVVVQTGLGTVVLTGDVVYKYANIEGDRAINTAERDRVINSPDPDACRKAMARIREEADYVLPAHDPLTLVRWPDGIIGAQPAGRERVELPAFALVVPARMSRPLAYAVEQLSEFARGPCAMTVSSATQWPLVAGPVVLVGREQAEEHVPWLCQNVSWDDLGDEGFVLRLSWCRSRPAIVAAGRTDAGTRQAIYALMRELDLSRLPPTLPAGLYKKEKPSFALRGMYAHQHWAYEYPYALRTWKVEEWKQYVDILALLHANLFQIWSMAGILPVPFSPEDAAFLRRYPPVIDHAKQNHGMEVWIGECANNMCDRRDVPPVAQRDYFQVEALKNPADPAQMAQLRAARAAFYKVCNNADGYWVIDSDPGKWPGSPSKEFVDILMMNRGLMNEDTLLGPKAKLVYWMWFGWGTGSREQNWRDTLTDLVRRSPEPWWMTVASKEHWKVVDELGLADRVVYYPYGTVEPEPSLPFTTVEPDHLRAAVDVPDRIGKIRGVMANAQTPLCQLPNIAYFMNSAWRMDRRTEAPAQMVHELARWIYPEHTDSLARAWLCLRDPEARDADALADELAKLEKEHRLGRPGPIGFKLFPDYGQVARDLSTMLRIHSAAMGFCRMVQAGGADDQELLERLERYCLLSLAWRKHTGFRNYGTNGCNFFPLREAVHKRWWRDNQLDPQVRRSLAEAMKAQYEDWEVDLILGPLSR
jgi:N-acyl homoserine lactone hydrolase